VRPATDAPLADRVAAMLAGPLGPHPLRDALTSILCQALQEDPALRFASAAAMREALLGAGTLSQGVGDDYSRTEIMRVPPPRTLAAAGSRASESLVSVLSTDSVAVVEQRLASYIGPLARILVKKALRSHRSTAEFSQALASHIPSQREREQFLRDISSLSRASQLPGEGSQHASGPPSPGASIGSVWDSVDRAALEEIGGLFSFYTGAIAQRLLKATARRTATLEQLVEQLAAYIPNPQERAEFLGAINKRRKR
jgi:serine/threonine-protein kinase